MDRRRTGPRVGVYICHCGVNIASVVRVDEVREFASRLEHVIVARDYKFMCSNVGQELIIRDIKGQGLNRVVVASCSPRMHEKTFREACQRAGLNPYLFQMASIREQVSWVTEDPDLATEKAKDLLKAAVYRVVQHKPLSPRIVEIKDRVLVVGAGIAGIEAALKIAEAGKTVYLLEREPSIGGHMARFDKTFPTLDCAACILTPKMVSVGQHEKIRLLTWSEITDLSGYVGHFKVKVRRRPRYVSEERCTGCGACFEVCPVSLPSEFDCRLRNRPAIYKPFPQAVPNVAIIDKQGLSPCRVTCPAGINVHAYVRLASRGKYKEAFAKIMEKVIFPGALGRVCPAYCQRRCSREKAGGAVQIRALKRFIADWYYQNVGPIPPFPVPKKKKDRPVAIVGSGPAGLACAFYLALAGHPVVVFEAEEQPGGMLRYGIPEYRLPNSLLDQEIELIRQAGVEIRCGQRIDPDRIQKLREDFAALFLATGLNKERRLEIPGGDLTGVYYALEFLRGVNTGQINKVGEKVAVIGGGNTAIDAARCALRLGARQVTIYYRRTEKEMPAFPQEIAEAREEGIEFEFLVAPLAFEGRDGRLVGLRCQRMRLGRPDRSGRPEPIPLSGSEFTVPAETAILALGQMPDEEFIQGLSLKTKADGSILVDKATLMTSAPGVFAGGDLVTSSGSVVRAIAQGRKAAFYIDAYLSGQALKGLEFDLRQRPVSTKEVLSRRSPLKSQPITLPRRSLKERLASFAEVELTLSEKEAQTEANRCLDCAGCCECLECLKVCEAQAIDHQDQGQEVELEVGSIVVATGFKTFNPSGLRRYGYGRFPEVYTSLEFERLNNASGPTRGEIRLKDGRRPESVAIIHCVGSRDEQTHRYCSRVCCLYSMKFAHLVREKTGAEVWEFYIDIRAPGKGYEEFYNRIQEEGVHFIRGRVAEVTDAALYKHEKGKLIVVVEDTLAGIQRRIPTDMVILSVALEPASGAGKIAHLMGINQDADGWFSELHPKLAPVATAADGIFIAGCCQGPKDIPDTVAQAAAAASEALSLIMKGRVELEPTSAVVDPDLCVGCRQCLSVCPFGAITYDTAKRICQVNEVLCKGCGLCASTCPSKAVGVRHFGNNEIISELEGILY